MSISIDQLTEETTLATDDVLHLYDNSESADNKIQLSTLIAFIQRVGRGSFTNLVCTVNATNPTYQVDIDADGVTLYDGTRTYQAASVNLTVDITASGANGLDTGAEANSTWYYLYVIYNGTTVAGLASTSASSPTMPSGYTYKKLVGAVYNGSGGDFRAFRQAGVRGSYASTQNILSGGSSASFASVSHTSPSNASHIYVSLRDVGGANSSYEFSWDGTNSSDKFYGVTGLQVPSVAMALSSAGAVYYKRTAGTGTLTMDQTGYILNI